MKVLGQISVEFKHHTAYYSMTYPNIHGLEVPLERSVKGWGVDTLWNVDTLCELVNILQRTLDTWKKRRNTTFNFKEQV